MTEENDWSEDDLDFSGKFLFRKKAIISRLWMAFLIWDGDNGDHSQEHPIFWG